MYSIARRAVLTAPRQPLARRLASGGRAEPSQSDGASLASRARRDPELFVSTSTIAMRMLTHLATLAHCRKHNRLCGLLLLPQPNFEQLSQ